MKIGSVNPAGGDGGLDDFETQITRLRAEVAALHREAESATVAVRKAGASTHSAIEEVQHEVVRRSAQGIHGGQTHGAGGHSGSMHLLHQLHAVHRLTSGGNMMSARSLRTGFRALGNLTGGAMELGALLGPAMLGAFVAHEVMNTVREHYEEEKKVAEAQIEMYKVAADQQLSEEARGTGVDVYSMRKNAQAKGIQQAKAKRGFFSGIYHGITESIMGQDLEAEQLGATEAKATIERAKKAQQLRGGRLDEAMRAFQVDPESQAVWSKLKSEMSIREMGFTSHENLRARREEIAHKMEDEMIASEERKRAQEMMTLEMQEPSTKALIKQTHEYFHAMEEQIHTQRQSWAMT